MNRLTPKLRISHTLLATAIGVFRLSAAQEPTFTAITDSPISDNHVFSAAWGDYDRDGFVDLLAVEEYPDTLEKGVGRIYLFRNHQDGTFEKRTLEPSAYRHTGYIHGAIWGDYDNDGVPDILVSGGGVWDGPNPHILMHQDANGRFSRSTSPAFRTGNSQANLWGDFDNDGRLDIFAGYWTGTGTPVTDILYRNDGEGAFTDIKAPGIDQLNDNENSAVASVTGDFNGDGLIDILVTTISPNRSRLYLNAGDLRFDRLLVTPSAPRAWAGDNRNAAHGLAVADYDNDGDLDFLTASKSGLFGWTCACDGDLTGRTILYRNDGFGEFDAVAGGDLGTDESIGANSGAWADYNNDGWLDVVLFRGVYSDGRGHDPTDLLYRNNGDGTFTRVMTGPIVNEDGDARAGAWGDIDNDGDMDLVVANYNWHASAGSNRYPVLYRNEGNDNHWLKLSLIGTESNRDAVGAKVRVRAHINGEEVWQLRELRTNAGWIASQNDMRPHFGLGDAGSADIVRVEWPSGTVQELTDVAVNQILQVVEPPRLRLESANVLSWPASAEGFQLESAANIEGPWAGATETVEANGNRMSVTVQTEGEITFYRLSER